MGPVEIKNVHWVKNNTGLDLYFENFRIYMCKYVSNVSQFRLNKKNDSVLRVQISLDKGVHLRKDRQIFFNAVWNGTHWFSTSIYRDLS